MESEGISRDDLEAAALDWVGWFTHAAHQWNSAEVLQRFCNSVAKSVRWMGFLFSRIPTDGVFVVQFGIPVDVINRCDPGLDPAYIVELINTEPGKEIGAWHETGSNYGDCIVLERYYYIPKEHRDNWVYSDAIPEREQQLLVPLAKLLDSESNLASRAAEFSRWLVGSRFVKYVPSPDGMG